MDVVGCLGCDQPVTAAVVARYGGARAEQLQALMLAHGETSHMADIEAFCARARELFGHSG